MSTAAVPCTTAASRQFLASNGVLETDLAASRQRRADGPDNSLVEEVQPLSPRKSASMKFALAQHLPGLPAINAVV